MPTPPQHDTGWNGSAEGLGASDPTIAEGRGQLWVMSPAERVAAMHRGELSLDQLAAWSRARPDEVPLVNGEFAWIALSMPEVAD